MRFAFRPIAAWPREETANRKASPFGATWERTTNDLQRELEHIEAESPVVLQVDVNEADIRLDGLPRSQARWYSPRVILSFDSSLVGALSYPCDTYSHWQANVRAISLTLTALRSIERYGAAGMHEQYTGWKALPSQTGNTLSTEQSALVIGSWSKVAPATIIADAAIAKEAVRMAKSKTHPDRHEGNRAMWDDVEHSASVLSSLHGVSL